MSTVPQEDHGPEIGEQHDVQAMHAPIMRERAEPRDGYEPIHPIWSLVFGALIFWGGWYLGRYGGGFDRDVMDEKRGAGAGPVESAPVDPVVLGERIYNGKCVACHQPDGKGRPGQFPPLAGSEWVAGSPATLSRVLLHGLQGDVVVSGSRFNATMPALGGLLKDEQIAAVLTYVRQAWGNGAVPVEAKTVAAARAATAKRTTPWITDDLAREPKEDVQVPDQPKK